MRLSSLAASEGRDIRAAFSRDIPPSPGDPSHQVKGIRRLGHSDKEPCVDSCSWGGGEGVCCWALWDQDPMPERSLRCPKQYLPR